MNNFTTSEVKYNVVINNEEQYSIWPAHLPVPSGWQKVKVAMSKSECLQLIESLWADMRPLSMREKLSFRETLPTNSDTV